MPTLPLPGALLPSSSEKGLADGDPFAGIDAWCKGLLLGRSKSNPRQKGCSFLWKRRYCKFWEASFAFFVASKHGILLGKFFFLKLYIYSTGPSSPHFCESMTFSYSFPGSDQVVGIRNNSRDVPVHCELLPDHTSDDNIKSPPKEMLSTSTSLVYDSTLVPLNSFLQLGCRFIC